MSRVRVDPWCGCTPPPLLPPHCPAAACSGLKLEVRKCPSPRLHQRGTVIEASQRAEQCVPVLEIKPSQLGCVWLSALSGCSRPYVPERTVMITALVMILTMPEPWRRQISLITRRLSGWGWQGRRVEAARRPSDHRRSCARVCVCVNLFPGCDWRRRPQCSQWLAN